MIKTLHVLVSAVPLASAALLPAAAPPTGMPAAPAGAQARQPLAAIAPAIGCEALGRADLKGVADTPTAIRSAAVVTTPKGEYCKVQGTVAPAIDFEVQLPLKGWTQRYLQTGCGGLCGMVNMHVDYAGGCAPALNGELVVATNNLGHTAVRNKTGFDWNAEGAFGADPQKRIDFAYRANHVTAVVAKALMRTFYGRGPRYSYFSGCSDGGREALVEAQRYPEDFDGISAGDPAMAFTVQNSFNHAWSVQANTRSDGTRILLADKAPALHAAVIAHCDTLDGVQDGLLSDPRACKVDPAWAQCSPGAAASTACLTAEEVAVARKLYDGPVDEQGNHLTVGGPAPGSELQWRGLLPREATASTNNAAMAASFVSNVILPEVSPADGDVSRFAFTKANFERLTQLHGLYDATNTDIRPFAARGGKLILWHGWADDAIPPAISIAYYKGVQDTLGAAAADRTVKLFMFPGLGHCVGGDGFTQFDTLSAMMSWVERGVAPTQIIAGKLAEERPMGPGSGGPAQPYAMPDKPVVATRPIYPFPLIARYTGKGDPNAASSYQPSRSSVVESASGEWYGRGLIAPAVQRWWSVVNGKLVARGS